MKHLFLLFLACAAFALPVPKPAAPVSMKDFLVNTVYPATYVLYKETEDGGHKMLCTATAFESKPGHFGYKLVRFASASHCIDKPNKPTPIAIFFGPTMEDAELPVTYFLSNDEGDEKTYTRALVIGTGDRMKGDDFSVLEIHTRQDIPIVPLGHDPEDAFYQPIFNIADPAGIGKQVFRGNVTRVSLDRHLGPDGSDWYQSMLIEVPGFNHGSSGSSIICEQQQAVCGFGVGMIDGTTMVAMPVSRFTAWYKAISMPPEARPLPSAKLKRPSRPSAKVKK